jgi:GTP-sensing pleiotropic transcriptional regulator CodY
MQEDPKIPYVQLGLESDFAHFSRVLAHPARVTILLEMMKNHGIVEGRVVDVPGMSPSTVIQHLREMKKSGLIDGRIFGMRSKYWISKDAMLTFKEISREFFQAFETLA